MAKKPPRIGLFIDSENAPINHLQNIIKLSKHYGKLIVKRAYGAFDQPHMAGQADALKKLEIEAIPLENYVAGKNAADMCLAMEAVLYRERNEVDAVWVVSSDSDFTPLCDLLRSMDTQVIGISEQNKTSDAFRQACNQHFYVEKLDKELAKHQPKPKPKPKPKQTSIIDTIAQVFAKLVESDGWANLNKIEAKLRKHDSNYKAKLGGNTLAKWFDQSSNYTRKDHRVQKAKKAPQPKNSNGVQHDLLIQAFDRSQQANGWAYVGELGSSLRKIDSHYEQHFGSTKLSKWLQKYPETFQMKKNHVRRI